MKSISFYLIAFLFVLFMSLNSYSQFKVNVDGSNSMGYSGYPNINMGYDGNTHPVTGTVWGRWGVEVLGQDFNIWKPWPSAFNGLSRNYYLYINVAGGVGIGKAPTQSGICLDVLGNVYSYGVLLTSDERLKENIKPLKDKVNGLYSLDGKSYTKKLSEERLPVAETKNMSDEVKQAKQEDNKKELKVERKEFGFLAQDLKKIYPELVSQDTMGVYYVDYLGLIPIMVEALKEQKAEIEELRAMISSYGNSSAKKVSSLNVEEYEDVVAPVLEQNVPNPFNVSTTIKYNLPLLSESAAIFVYDMNGNQLKRYSIPQAGSGQIEIQGSELNAGMYLYALIADGKVIDTKRMILTK